MTTRNWQITSFVLGADRVGGGGGGGEEAIGNG